MATKRTTPTKRFPMYALEGAYHDSAYIVYSDEDLSKAVENFRDNGYASLDEITIHKISESGKAKMTITFEKKDAE